MNILKLNRILTVTAVSLFLFSSGCVWMINKTIDLKTGVSQSVLVDSENYSDCIYAALHSMEDIHNIKKTTLKSGGFYYKYKYGNRDENYKSGISNINKNYTLYNSIIISGDPEKSKKDIYYKRLDPISTVIGNFCGVKLLQDTKRKSIFEINDMYRN